MNQTYFVSLTEETKKFSETITLLSEKMSINDLCRRIFKITGEDFFIMKISPTSSVTSNVVIKFIRNSIYFKNFGDSKTLKVSNRVKALFSPSISVSIVFESNIEGLIKLFKERAPKILKI